MQDYSHVLSKENDFQVYPVESLFEMELVLSVTFFAYVQLAHSSSDDRKVTHLIILNHISGTPGLFPLLICSLWCVQTETSI